MNKPNSITMGDNSPDGTEWIRIAADGFWVRGQKVPQDDKEAQAVYNAFRQWLTWALTTQGH